MPKPISSAQNLRKPVYVDARSLAGKRLSGIGLLTANLLEELSANQVFSQQYELILVCTRGERDLVGLHNSIGAEVRCLPVVTRKMINLLNYVHLLPSIDRIIGRGIYLFPDYANYPLSRKSRSITWIHDLAFLQFPETVSPRLQKRLFKNTPVWVKRSNLVISLSRVVKGEIEEAFNIATEKVLVVGAGVNKDVFSRQSEQMILEVEKKYDLPNKYVLFVGNIEPRKNLERLIEAYVQIESSLRDAHPLVIIGGAGGWNNDRIYEAIRSASSGGAKIIQPSQFVENEDLAAVISGSSLLVNPAIYEGFGMTPLEALACRVQVAVSDIPVFHEIYGTYATYFDPQDTQDISRTLTSILQMPSSVDAQQLIDQYSWKNSATKLYDIISDIDVDK